MAGIVGSVVDALDAISSLSLSPSALLSAPLSLALSVGFAVTFVSTVTTDGLAASVADVPTGEAAAGEMMVDVRDTLPDDDKVAGDGIGRAPAPATASMPVATMDTRITPSSFSSKVDPKMITASLSTSRRTRLAASSTSNRVISRPPVTLINTARAPCMVMSSSSGLLIAASAACVARLSPDASPVPIMALPISLITARMSAKSRLIWPGLIIRSVTPATPWCNTVSAMWNASAKVVRSFASRNRFWFGMTISVST